MEHGLEGVMYNTLNGQLIELLLTAKDWNGRKRTEGGDCFEVEIDEDVGYHSDSKCTIFGSSSLGSAKHSWKGCI